MNKLAVLISAKNEETVLPHTLAALRNYVNLEDVYLISDGSTDRTDVIARSFGMHFIRNDRSIGKTSSLQRIISHFRIIERYEYVFILDADTIPDSTFFPHALKHFEDPEIACVCGQVRTIVKQNVFIAYRATLYFIWQNVYKRIASWFNAVMIAPGTASIYRTSVLAHIDFDNSLIIEDFDFTYQVHRKKLGKIIYEPKATILSQDPDNLPDYYKQLTRWTLGMLQAARKHRLPLGLRPFEVLTVALAFQELIHSIFVIGLALVNLWVWLLALYPSLFGIYIEKWIITGLLLFDMFFIVVVGIISLIAIKQYRVLAYVPMLWLVTFVNMTSFLHALYLTLFRRVYSGWDSPRRHDPAEHTAGRVASIPAPVVSLATVLPTDYQNPGSGVGDRVSPVDRNKEVGAIVRTGAHVSPQDTQTRLF